MESGEDLKTNQNYMHLVIHGTLYQGSLTLLLYLLLGKTLYGNYDMKDAELRFIFDDIFARQVALAEALNVIADHIGAKRYEIADDGSQTRVPVCVLPPIFFERIGAQKKREAERRRGQPTGPQDPTIIGRREHE